MKIKKKQINHISRQVKDQSDEVLTEIETCVERNSSISIKEATILKGLISSSFSGIF